MTCDKTVKGVEINKMDYQIKNPILPGFYPDPSIVRVEDDFYMVASSFAYFPGIPIFHSKDLAHWEQIGHVLDRPEQLPLNAENMSYGIWAPTIRYYNGMYYVSATNVDHGFNFIVTAKDPAGEWSNPHWMKGAYGIDPSLFVDENGKTYLLTTGNVADGVDENGKPHFLTEDGTVDARDNEILLYEIDLNEIDLEDFTLKGKATSIWNGAMKGAWSPESPHLYKKDQWYYLLTAEGGTEHYHSVVVARSKNIEGPYENYRGNPILTHRHLGIRYPIDNVGHGDLVELKDGSWYMVLLGSRPYGGYHKNMGRETFLVPVEWEDGWPIVCPGSGKVEWTYPAPNLPIFEVEEEPERDEFEKEELADYWNFLGTPEKDTCKVEQGFLKIKLCAFPMEKRTNNPLFVNVEPTVCCAGFLGRRQRHIRFTAETKLVFSPVESQTAGIILLQNDFHSIRMEMAVENDVKMIRVVKGYASLESSLTYKDNMENFHKERCGSIPWEKEEAVLGIEAEGQKISMYVKDEEEKKYIARDEDGGLLGSETSGGFLGTYVGMFASGNGKEYQQYAAFDWFCYKGISCESR